MRVPKTKDDAINLLIDELFELHDVYQWTIIDHATIDESMKMLDPKFARVRLARAYYEAFKDAEVNG